MLVNGIDKKIADAHLHCRFVDKDLTRKMLDDVSSLGITDACLQALPYRGAAENLFTLYIKMTQKQPDVRAFCGPHITDRYAKIAPEKQIEALLKLGADGIKLMFSPDLQKYTGKALDDEYYEPMLDISRKMTCPCLFTLPTPRSFGTRVVRIAMAASHRRS